ncbi:MAG TPA: hypothetical protein VE954_23085 [Oligoflexus sp.]|uniref:LA_2272 family surface repeat-containing protein n=1 Tax=Oligoflexus sp. TaxID=1971216 RepID=UPI002D32A90D|nr:hypothetical protein [Oligoflexus sp.]HYX35997.1 hypothetical protein [Oligoflexus sp.]
MKLYPVFLILLLFGFPLLAEDANQSRQRDVPLTLSVLGPVSSNCGKYEQTNSYFCLGLINCSLANSYVLTLALSGYNITDYDMEGYSLALLGNFAGRDTQGFQFSFLANTTRRRMYGLQISFVNVVLEESVIGAQIGAFNINFGETIGAQMGFFNSTQESVTGLQIGLVNTVQNSEESGPDFAVQFGLINYSANPRVLPIGFINIVHGGRLQLELNRSVLGIPRIDFIMGSPYLYSIFTLDSYTISSRDKKESANTAAAMEGVGLGAAIPIGPVYSLRLERRQYFPTKSRPDLARVERWLLERKVSRAFALSVGLEKNLFLNSAVDRSRWVQSKANQIRSLTTGVSWNLLSGL